MGLHVPAEVVLNRRGAKPALMFALLLMFAGAMSGCAGLGRGMRFFSRGIGPLFDTPRVPASRVDDPVLPGARLAVTWVGHATVLIQLDDKFILTDPVFTDTVGQVSKRLVYPGLDPFKLPPIDAVIVSHMHFDHLSLGTLAQLEPKLKRVFVPEGGLVYVPDFDFPSIEIRRWQTWAEDGTPDGLRITAVPVQHYGFRYAGDRDWMTTSFTGYVVEYHGLKVYFGGDTGYSDTFFKETGKRFPGIDLAILPIGPIEPRDFMQHAHADPADALRAFRDLGAKEMLPMHYDTFINSTDKPGAVRTALERAMTENPDLRVVPLEIGERRKLR